ncbi:MULTISPECIES: homocitrate synthase [Clostridium]|jgi:homocitrate synthase NifV|uniref:Homocitrate synthase NifV n=1 Tax=Clostridium intestinale DSM 6191 TaxID=1121320 RepID=A0A1M5YKF5_9CLOT|nr:MULTISPECIES: homocitrate synthase [Clostridium]WRY51176.1 homocitrate synthase [Clostridium intestinale]SHI12501.1 homocitrate synthase NifV [Clostridium intestinale DSM 6191]
MNNNIFIVDTTLRDGEQSPDIAFSLKKKIAIAKIMDNNKIYQIEAGIPAMGEIEKRCIYKIMEQKKNSLISVWNRLNKQDLIDSIDCNPDIIHISIPVSDIQIYSKLKKDRKWVVNKMRECVNFVKDKDYEVTVGFEDASRADINFIIHMAKILKDLGVNRIRYADTVGILIPSTTRTAITNILENVPIDIEMHAHNDFGMALANSIEAAKSGARFVDCTMNGIGERAGNCNLQEFIRVSSRLFNINDGALKNSI